MYVPELFRTLYGFLKSCFGRSSVGSSVKKIKYALVIENKYIQNENPIITCLVMGNILSRHNGTFSSWKFQIIFNYLHKLIGPMQNVMQEFLSRASHVSGNFSQMPRNEVC